MTIFASAPVPERNYPLPRPTVVAAGGADDQRFTVGLTIDVAQVLTDRGYPPMTGRDLIELQQALFGFLYRDNLAGGAVVDPCAYANLRGSDAWHEHDHDACVDAVTDHAGGAA
jgi:hypothetical protein